VVSLDAPASVQSGDLVTVTANAANRGSVPGGAAFTLRTGDVSQTRSVRVDARTTAPLSFQVRLAGTNRAVVTVDGKRVTIKLTHPSDPVPVPDDFRVSRFAGSVIALEWAPVEGASYQVFRRSPDGIYTTPLAEVPAGTTTYVDGTVTLGNTYSYVIRAVVAGRTSIASPEVTQQTSAQPVQVTWRVRVPDNTPPGDVIYMPGSLSELGPWDPAKVAMTQVDPGIWEVTLPVMEGTGVQYKYTRGSWDTVEHWGEIVGITSRYVVITYGTEGTQLIDNTSRDPATPDSDEAVGAWIDIP
jgi:hypothetical protein